MANLLTFGREDLEGLAPRGSPALPGGRVGSGVVTPAGNSSRFAMSYVRRQTLPGQTAYNPYCTRRLRDSLHHVQRCTGASLVQPTRLQEIRWDPTSQSTLALKLPPSTCSARPRNGCESPLRTSPGSWRDRPCVTWRGSSSHSREDTELIDSSLLRPHFVERYLAFTHSARRRSEEWPNNRQSWPVPRQR